MLLDGPLLVVVDALAVFRLAVLVTEDVFPPVAWVREWILARWPSDETAFGVDEVRQLSQGRGVTKHGHRVEQDGDYFWPVKPYKWAKLLTCVSCASVWLAGLAVAGEFWFPAVWRPVALLLALSAAAVLLNLLRTGR